MNLTPELLVAATGCKPQVAAVVAPPLAQAMLLRGITTPLRMAHFLAQCAHESALFTRTTESLDYSAEALVAVWPTRFYLPPKEANGRENARDYGRDVDRAARQIEIALVAYSDRMGNGPRESVDGWRYRGRGYIQLTGRDAYTRFNAADPSVLSITYPDTLATPEGAAKSAAWFWQGKGCNPAADADDCVAVTRMVNGGSIGLQDRIELTKRARQALSST